MFIEAENIRKSYGRKTAVLNSTSFHAASGEYIAIVGANGCGKSTLVNILIGKIKPDSGTVAMGETVKTKKQKKSWFKGLKAEFKKIVWPDQKSLTKETAAVVIVSVVVGVIISVVDLIARFGIEFLVK